MRLPTYHSESSPSASSGRTRTHVFRFCARVGGAKNPRSAAGYEGQIVWNSDKPDGQLKKILDIARMRNVLDWRPPTDLRSGLLNTAHWYLQNKEEADKKW